jgi:hypothetical protein
MIPGANILSMALSVIGRQSFTYYPYTSRSTSAIGVYATTYGTGAAITGSAQPIPHDLNDKYGLDFQDNGFRFFCSQSVLDVNRDSAGDRIVFSGLYYQVLSITPWFQIDGWVEIVSIQVPST